MIQDAYLGMKLRFAEITFSDRQRKFLEGFHCDIGEKDEVTTTILRAANAVDPFELSEFRNLASHMLEQLPLVAEKLEEVKPSEQHRSVLIGHLVDAAFAYCLKQCLFDIAVISA